MTMFWLVLLALVAGFLLFKLGVLTVWFAVLQGLLKVLFVVSGLFLVVAAGKWLLRRRQLR